MESDPLHGGKHGGDGHGVGGIRERQQSGILGVSLEPWVHGHVFY